MQLSASSAQNFSIPHRIAEVIEYNSIGSEHYGRTLTFTGGKTEYVPLCTLSTNPIFPTASQESTTSRGQQHQ